MKQFLLPIYQTCQV